MAKQNERPIIFPLSNPITHAEAAPADVERWSEGRAIIGAGSPFPPLKRNGKSISVDQTNNSYIFPGVGLGVIATQARRITDTMFMAAAKALAELSPAKNDATPISCRRSPRCARWRRRSPSPSAGRR